MVSVEHVLWGSDDEGSGLRHGEDEARKEEGTDEGHLQGHEARAREVQGVQGSREQGGQGGRCVTPSSEEHAELSRERIREGTLEPGSSSGSEEMNSHVRRLNSVRSGPLLLAKQAASSGLPRVLGRQEGGQGIISSQHDGEGKVGVQSKRWTEEGSNQAGANLAQNPTAQREVAERDNSPHQNEVHMGMREGRVSEMESSGRVSREFSETSTSDWDGGNGALFILSSGRTRKRQGAQT